MKQKLSQEVMRRKSLGEIVLGAVRIQRPRIVEALAEVLNPLLQPEEVLPDFGLTLELYGRNLELHSRRMEDADEAHRQELTRFDRIRALRDELTDRLKERFLSLRSTCTGVLGESSLAPLGLDFNLAQEAKGVLAQSRIVRDRLRQSDIELVPERWFTGSLDPESMAQEFDDDVEALSTTLRELIDQQKKVDVALVAKSQAIDDHDKTFIPIARSLEAMFRVAGETELAERIRPTVRRLTRPNEGEAPPPAEESSEESAEESAEPSAEASAPPSGGSPPEESAPPSEESAEESTSAS